MTCHMNRAEWIRRLHQARAPLLILVCALVLLLSTGKSAEKNDQVIQPSDKTMQNDLDEDETRLEEILQLIDGVGKTRVLLSSRFSAQTEYVTDDGKTVLLSAGSGKQEALSARIRCPEYLGAVIVCQGGGDPKIRLCVMEAVARFTGLRADQITIQKLQE